MDQFTALKHLLATAPRRIAELQAVLKKMAEENAGLRRQLAKNRDNSGNPLSSNGLIQPVPHSLRFKSGMLNGGRVGHRSNTSRHTSSPTSWSA